MSNKKLSERLETLNLDGTTVGWEDCQHCESIIEAVRELEVANEQLQDAYSKDHLTWKKDAEKLYARLGQDRESLTYEIKLCMDERDAAIRERDEARAELERLRKADALCDALNVECLRQRDAALVKLSAVREWALGVVYPLLGTAEVDFDYGYSDAQRDLLAILDRQKECNTNNHCWCQMLDGHVECSKCGQKESGTAPVAADTEVVTREVVLYERETFRGTIVQHVVTGSHWDSITEHGTSLVELARATVTFYVKKAP